MLPDMTIIAPSVLVASLTTTVLAPAAADDSWAWPLDPRPAVVERFDPPDDAYGPGHRGLDLAGAVGDDVRAVADGTVAYVGHIAGVGIVTIDHGGVESTYQPLDPSVARGARVEGGETIGTLTDTDSHCAPDACLHIGRIVDDAYRDPLALLPSTSAVRLITPFGEPPVPPPVSVGPVDGDGRLAMPVDGPITSAYGMRLHPILHVWKLHDGTDFGVG